ncbi:hypothetical protein GCK32_003655 [Trichostrongylus colubriformis]|uniref:EF-hand domain-containing protein n=1 Tax=Trichostrongylus colubriformis TaxID=6319 RepID=A0AAN8G1D3_TRICO
MSIAVVFLFIVAMGMIEAPPPGERAEQENVIESLPSNMDPVERPVHLDGVILERDGELNKEFRQEVLLGGGKPRDSTELREMVKKMFYETDLNNDGALSLDELKARIIENTRAHIQEAVIEAQSHFNIVDTNKDGQVSWTEYAPHYLSKDSHKDGHDHEKVNSIDSVAGAERVSFGKADLNSNGLLDSEEWLRFFHPEHNKDSLRQMAADILQRYDSDGDGKVTRQEFAFAHSFDKEDDEKTIQKRKAEREAEFDKQIDANGDGVATIDEIFEYINPANAKSLAAEASELIDSIDSDGDGKLTLDELLEQDRLVEFSPLISVAETLHDDL